MEEKGDASESRLRPASRARMENKQWLDCGVTQAVKGEIQELLLR
jgi:hypothetical protein